MIKIIVSIILLTNISALSQNVEFENDARKLAELNFDKSYFDNIKSITLYKSSDSEKENFEKDYTLIVDKFYHKMADFFMIKYTHKEIKEALNFYETPAGMKILNDIKLINLNNFPEKNEFSDQLKSIKILE